MLIELLHLIQNFMDFLSKVYDFLFFPLYSQYQIFIHIKILTVSQYFKVLDLFKPLPLLILFLSLLIIFFQIHQVPRYYKFFFKTFCRNLILYSSQNGAINLLN